MATLNSLKWQLRQKVITTAPSPTQPLSDTQYSVGFDILLQSSGRATYQEFIIPQLSLLLAPLFNSRSHVSVLEVGPGPKSVLGSLPSWLRRKVKKYAAFEPNDLFATRLEKWLCSTSETETGLPLPCLESSPDIHRIPFSLEKESNESTAEKFDVVLFCHSMYGMKPKRRYIERALDMLVEQPEGGLVVVFHRDGNLHLDGLMCHRTASFPTGVIRVADDDTTLDCFTPFMAGRVLPDGDADKSLRAEWRQVCCALGGREEAHPGYLVFSSPNIMAAFTWHAAALPELTAQVPLVTEKKVKSWEARLHHPAAVMRPTEVRHVQECVRWALKYGVSLTVIGGGHSGHCMWPNVVAVDMDSFDRVHILKDGESSSGPLVVAEAGCKSGDIVGQSMEAGLIVPLGARPSVGAGLWLQGGIGHLARLHGLACDAVVGAVVVSVASAQAQVLCVGCVPNQYRPAGAVRPENEDDLLWAIKGAGTNFGIVVSVTFKAYTAPTYSIRNWVLPLNNNAEAQLKLGEFDELIARKLPRKCSADAYLYWDTGKLHLGVTMFESSVTCPATNNRTSTPTSTPIATVLEPENSSQTVDSVGLFETEMYVSGMHSGHGGGKTNSFKRCVFLKHIGAAKVADILVAAVENHPSPLSYLHLLQGGGAVGDVPEDATAFGCRDWDFACVITGVWPRNQEGTELERAAVQWVYKIVGDLLPLSTGVYGADLGPDPRDAALAAKAFGPNRPRLARLKHLWDPSNVLAYACPLQPAEAPTEQPPKLIILVTGESCAGKDYCADIWVSVFTTYSGKHLKARAVSISNATKREYAASTGADLERLLSDRAYKEKHRPALGMYFQDQVRQRPPLPEEHFLNVVYSAGDVDVLFVTGMRDEAPVATFSHLVPNSRLLEVEVKGGRTTRQLRRGCQLDSDGDSDDDKSRSDHPSFTFNNDTAGNEAAKRFAQNHLLPFIHEDMDRLASMVPSVPNFPRPGIEFRHVLDISQQPGGLALCTSLLQSHFTETWENVGVVACCETGGFIYAAALAARVDIPLALIREAGKLPPPTISVVKSASHISGSSLAPDDSESLSGEKRIEMGRDVVTAGASVVVVDDVLATGKTLCAVLRLLAEAGVGAERVTVMVVAEFPFHRGRELLRRCGFGKARIQSLLVFGGA